MKIEIKNLSRNYGTTKALDHISFEFETGQIVGFIGPNGAGKTTTIKIMSTLEQPDMGDVLYDGVSVLESPDEIRRIIGYMPDSLPGYKDIQVWEYLDFFARSFGLKGETRTKTLADIEEFTNIAGIRYKMLGALSKGMKQRVSLARALVHNPKVLIMDEPAAGLDPRARLELRALLKVLSEQGKAILLSSHILSELQDICNAAVIIEKGKILSSGALRTLLKDNQSTQVNVGTHATGESGLQLSVRCLSGKSEDVRCKLLEHPLIGNVTVLDGVEVHAIFKGEEEELGSVLQSLISAQLPIISFTLQEMGLEELFMKVTTGEVQ